MSRFQEKCIDSVLKRLAPGYYRERLELTRDLKRDFLTQSGWIKSMETRSAVDAEGNPTPWLAFPFIHFLKTRLKPEFEVFEYGSGNSTLFWINQGNKCTSVEDDKNWYEYCKEKTGNRARMIYKDTEESYANSIKEFGNFDIVLVDGSYRVKCASVAKECLSERGVLIVDNTDIHTGGEAKDHLIKNGFRCLSFKGLGAICDVETETSVFYRPNNIFEI